MTGMKHISVMTDEVFRYLEARRKGYYVDCTLGPGGHALQILKNNPKARLIGFDIDEISLNLARKNLKPYADRVVLYHSDFRYLPDLHINFSHIEGIYADLGVSSFQLNNPERGFSYNLKGPLDMRMDHRAKTNAAKIINKYSEHNLAEIFHEYGELRQAKRLAKEIATRRKFRKIETTDELRRLCERVCRWRPQKGKIHPAAKVFQALRIEVNQELKELDTFLEKVTYKLKPGARILIISFHSLEDRIVKHTFQKFASPNGERPLLKIITKKPVTPSETEVMKNSRARSAKLRAAERL
ncbi:MAG: 16S rRNA (cytosine(1402)-N(4))-methyltransferase RsmH [Candidatus Aminicenantes bacterium]|nr:16S rRNA (cytosine(1402)-N(4))-methyltransferase RsmH [Candidatus Aminicenantes bacterium]